MMFRSLLAAGLLAQLCAAQQSGWQASQVNATMCYWDSPRAAVVRDTLYIDGGTLWWTPGMSDDSYGPPTSDDNPLGIVYQLNFSTIFNTSAQTNISNVLTTQSKAPAGGAANNIAPNFYDGVMIANNFEWFTYGGLLMNTGKYTIPGSDFAASYEILGYGPPKQFHAGYVIEKLPDKVTRFVANGAGVSIPSENLGYYFGGLRSASWGPIYANPNLSTIADALSNTMIELDLAVQSSEVWNNFTLPTTVPGRINAELVWIPVSTRGVLIAIGGVVDASYAEFSRSLNATQVAETNLKSPLLMSTVSIYDISKQTWYQQPTSGTPPPMLTQGCTVVASAEDGSSHNIYWYGGWPGIDGTQPFSDDIWVLSVPSFTWIKVYSGTPSHGRAGHRCVKPYPDQMFVIGGYPALPGIQPRCLDGNLIQIFNLSSSTWIEQYHPSVWSNYTVPSAIISIVGGSPTGSATKSSPSPSGFSNVTLASLFSSPYNTSKITTFYPYPAATSPPSNTTSSPSPVPKPSSGGGTPKYLAPVLGVVLGLFFLTLLIVAYLIWTKRFLWKGSSNGRRESENGTLDNRRWVTSWLRATPVDVKAPTVTTDESVAYGEEGRDVDERQVGRVEMAPMPELGEEQVFEMMDTSHTHPTELDSQTSSSQPTNPTSNPFPPHHHPTFSTGLHPVLPSPSHSPHPNPHPRSLALGHTSSARSNTSTSTYSQISYPEIRPSVSPVMWADGNERGHARGISDGSFSTVHSGSGGAIQMVGGEPRVELGSGEGRGGINEGNVPPAVPDPPVPRRGTGGMVSPLSPGHGRGAGRVIAEEGAEEEGEIGRLGSGIGIGREGSKRISNFSEELGDR